MVACRKMHLRIYISCILPVLLFSNIVSSKKSADDNSYTYTDTFNNNGRKQNDVVTLKRTPQHLEGSGGNSGDGAIFDDDEDLAQVGSGDGGSSHQSRCENTRRNFRNGQYDFAPKCLENGEFDRQQCKTDMCWCVYANGDTIPGTEHKKKLSDKSSIHRDECIELANKDDDFGIGIDTDYNNNEIRPDMIGADGKRPKWDMYGDENDVEIQTVDPNTNHIEMMQSSDSQHHFLRSSNVMRQPGILAGIIGGTVVGLLCATLLVMFIVYRTRKKDEGSYALDEPRRLPINPAYVRANSKEYFA